MIYIIKNIIIEGPGNFTDCFRKLGKEFRIIELSRGEKLPDDNRNVDAVVVLGGPMNVYEEEKYLFLKDEDMFLKKALRDEVPILGICLGAQLLAKACGAKVKKAPVKEIGWYKVNLTSEGMSESIFNGLSEWLDVFQWHGDTFEIPKNGILLATSDHCINQAFKVGKNAYGFQFHPEVTNQEIIKWLDEYGTEINKKDWAVTKKDILNRYFKIEDRYKQQLNIICSNFIKIMKSS